MATYAQFIEFGPYYASGALCTLKVYHYIVGTTTLKDVYTDREKNTTAAQPLVSDANGIASCYADGLYKFQIDGSTDGVSYSTLYTYDKVAVADQSSLLSGEGAAISSASTLTLGADGDFFHVTGTTTTTAISGTQNEVTLVPDAAWPLTHSGNLILQSGADVVCTAGQVFRFLNEGAGVWRESSRSLMRDNTFTIGGSADATKKIAFEVDGLTTATTRTITPPDYNIRLSNLPAGIGPLPYAGSSVPTGWLPCDGAAVSRTTYAQLFTAISTTWGVGDGSTTFNVPNMAGRVPVGSGTGTQVASGVNADVDTTGDTLTVTSNTNAWITGMAVVLTLASGTITGVTTATTYYVIRSSATLIQLATTLALAQAGTAIDFTAKSSPVWSITYTLSARTRGTSGGEEAHAMSSTELLAHTHAQGGYYDGTAVQTGGGGVRNTTANTLSTGGNAAMNSMQPFAVVTYIISY